MGKFLILFLAPLLVAACQQQQQQQPQPAATATAAGGLRKISTTDSQMVARLRESGVKILVQQPDYIIVYSDSASANQIQTLAANALPATEKDLVQRLVRIHFADKAQLQKIVDLGVDLWDEQGDSATARVYDLHLEQLKQAGFSFRILKMDASAKEDK